MNAANGARNRILAVLFIGILMSALDIAIIGPALPVVKGQFSLSERAAAWLFTIYILFFLISTPLMAKLSDLLGRRAVYAADVFLFGAGSLVFALAPDLSFLLLGRAVQGFGAGGIMPVANAAVGDMFPVEKRGTALGVLQAVFGISFVLGPVLGGLLLKYDWRYLFLINIPVALLVIVMSLRSLPGRLPAAGRPRFDGAGTVLLSVLLASLAYGISRIDTARLAKSIFSSGVLPFLAAAALLVPVFIFLERRREEPVFPVGLFCERHVALASGISAVTGLCIASFVFMPSLAALSLGLSHAEASFIMLPFVFSLSVVSIIAGKMLERVSAKAEMIAGTVLTTLGLLVLSLYPGSAVLFVLSGVVIGAGLAAMPIRFIMLSAVPSKDRTAAQGVLSMNMSIGQMIGGVFLGAVIASYGGQEAGYARGIFAVALVSVVMIAVAFGFRGGKTRDIEEPACAGKPGDVKER